jgi:hypothetical protein
MPIQQSTRLCALKAALGKREACPTEACPFWEPGGAVLGGRCALERLDFAADAPTARWLLEIRERLAAGSSEEEERVMRAAFHQLLNSSSE